MISSEATVDGAVGGQGEPLLDAQTAQALFDLSPNPYVVLTPDLKIAGANKAYLRALQVDLAQIAGRDLFEAFPSSAENQRLVRESLQRARDTRQPDHLAIVRYDLTRTQPDGSIVFEERYWSATHTPLVAGNGETRLILQHTQEVTELQRLREAAKAAGGLELGAAVFRRAAAVQRTNDELTSERRRLYELFRQAPGFNCILSGPDHVFEFANHAYERLIGRTNITGRTVKEALPEVAAQGFIDLLDDVYRTGRPYVGRNVRLELQRRPGAAAEEVFLDFIYQPIVEEDGSVSGIFVEGYDVTEQRASERAVKDSEGRLRLMLDELNHRVKNTIATVQSIAAQTGQTAETVPDFVQALNARLIALSHTHNALTRGNWAGADLGLILEFELKPYGPERVSISGPQVELSPRAAVTLGMCFHELATNAAKYGALSAPEGRLLVVWRVEPRDDMSVLVLDWTETGGPPVAPPTRRGFGSKLIQRSVSGELHGAANLDFQPDGLRCQMTFPLDRSA